MVQITENCLRNILRIFFFIGFSIDFITNMKKQPQEVFYSERCSYKFRKIHRKAPVPEPPF